MRWSIKNLRKHCNENAVCFDGNNWVPVRPLEIRCFKSRIKDAWAVLVGKADVVFWD